MKFGIVIFGSYPSGLKQLIYHVVAEPLPIHQFIGIEIDRDHHQVLHIPLHEDVEYGSQKLLLKATLEDCYSSLQTALIGLDAVIVIGGAKTQTMAADLIKVENRTKLLFVPVSILNDIQGSDLSLGYDTALNSIVESALKIQDTIQSVKYEQPRLFGVQIPANAPNHMLKELAVAAEGYFVSNHFSRTQLDQLCEEIDSNFSKDKTSSVLFYNEEIGSQYMNDKVIFRLNVDWKAMTIDEALCMGSHPTATDRILARKLANRIITWIKNGEKSGQIVVNRSEADFQVWDLMV